MFASMFLAQPQMGTCLLSLQTLQSTLNCPNHWLYLLKTNYFPHFLILNPFYGVTLLAFGNGAPDVFAAISASSDVDDMKTGSGEGFYLAAASSLGSGLFVSSIVSSAIAILSATAPNEEHAHGLGLG